MLSIKSVSLIIVAISESLTPIILLSLIFADPIITCIHLESIKLEEEGEERSTDGSVVNYHQFGVNINLLSEQFIIKMGPVFDRAEMEILGVINTREVSSELFDDGVFPIPDGSILVSHDTLRWSVCCASLWMDWQYYYHFEYLNKKYYEMTYCAG